MACFNFRRKFGEFSEIFGKVLLDVRLFEDEQVAKYYYFIIDPNQGVQTEYLPEHSGNSIYRCLRLSSEECASAVEKKEPGLEM